MPVSGISPYAIIRFKFELDACPFTYLERAGQACVYSDPVFVLGIPMPAVAHITPISLIASRHKIGSAFIYAHIRGLVLQPIFCLSQFGRDIKKQFSKALA